ncbi:MAG: glycosyltransferase family 9 protein, partial [Deltaproteobacteria bacterium]|nr:glycosyltransferase family 9 protein [Deltaproteobacteria bacterium]
STEAFPIAKKYPYIDRVWSFPIRELRNGKTRFFDILKLVRELRKIDFSLAVNLYRVYSLRGALKMGFLFLPLKAKIRVGHDHKGFGFFVDRKVAQESLANRHFADAMMEIAQMAGGIPDDRGIEVFWGSEAESKWGHLFTDPSTQRIAINPGADQTHKRWPPERYAAVADQLIERFDAEIILLGGPGEEHLSDMIQKAMKKNATNLAGKLTLNDLVYVISRMDLLLTNDSGPMHIAAALKTPLVAIFGPEDPKLFGPYTKPDLYRVISKDVDCRPCKTKRCTRPVCLDLITSEEVLEKCIELLKTVTGR